MEPLTAISMTLEEFKEMVHMHRVEHPEDTEHPRDMRTSHRANAHIKSRHSRGPSRHSRTTKT